MTTSLLDALERLQPHDHLCCIFETKEEEFASAAPFLRIGLERGEKCVFVADNGDELELVRPALESTGIEVDQSVRSGALVLETKEAAYLKGGHFEVAKTLDFWREKTAEALGKGYSALRVAGEAGWVVTQDGAGTAEWLKYESLVTNAFAELGCLGLCQYNRKLCPADLILNVIRTHPIVIYGDRVCQNFYYIPPEEFLADSSTEREVERMLRILHDRERIGEELKAAHDLLVNELSERTQAEREVRALTERLIHAHDEERTRIARELHDDLGQQIAALSISVSNLRRRIPQQEGETREQADRLYKGLSQLGSGIRNLSHQLHPAMLEHTRLDSALRSYCAEFPSLSGLRVSFEAAGAFEDVPSSVAVCIYRVTQEALQNVAKHAAAQDAAVRLTRSAGAVRLTVSDQGAGFQPDLASPSGGLGLVSMKERVKLANGVFAIESEPNRGTTLAVEIPIRR